MFFPLKSQSQKIFAVSSFPLRDAFYSSLKLSLLNVPGEA